MSRPIADLDVPLPRLKRDMKALVERQQAAALEDLRTHLPVDDPDRHALDTEADEAFARLAPEGGAL